MFAQTPVSTAIELRRVFWNIKPNLQWHNTQFAANSL